MPLSKTMKVIQSRDPSAVPRRARAPTADVPPVARKGSDARARLWLEVSRHPEQFTAVETSTVACLRPAKALVWCPASATCAECHEGSIIAAPHWLSNRNASWHPEIPRAQALLFRCFFVGFSLSTLACITEGNGSPPKARPRFHPQRPRERRLGVQHGGSVVHSPSLMPASNCTRLARMTLNLKINAEAKHSRHRDEQR